MKPGEAVDFHASPGFNLLAGRQHLFLNLGSNLWESRDSYRELERFSLGRPMEIKGVFGQQKTPETIAVSGVCLVDDTGFELYECYLNVVIENLLVF